MNTASVLLKFREPDRDVFRELPSNYPVSVLL